MSRYLIVIDMQNDFIDGALGTKEAQEILPRVIEKVRSFKGPVMFTRDTHDEDYLETQEGKRLPVTHCIGGTHGWELVKELDEYAKDHHSLIFDKESFGSQYLAGCLAGISRQVPIDEVELVGVCTDICVISNALLLKAAVPETRIIVDASCCAGVTPESHLTALKAMQACQIDIEGAEL
jgi:nicotinamidase-related amidase